MNTGSILAGRPSLGAWVTYGLGPANENLPTFVILTDDAEVLGGPEELELRLPARQLPGHAVPHTKARRFSIWRRPSTIDDEQQRGKLDLLAQLNRAFSADKHRKIPNWKRGSTPTNWPTGCRRPRRKRWISPRNPRPPESCTAWTNEATAKFGTNCLLARRLVERGVRFVELYSRQRQRLGRAHRHRRQSLADLPGVRQADRRPADGSESARLLDDTLVVWGGEFGRTPFNEKGNGRDHNPWGFTMWMAGGGIRGGQSSGRPTRSACAPIDGAMHVHDLHATILHALGLDHVKLTYLHNGRAERPTIVTGEVVQGRVQKPARRLNISPTTVRPSPGGRGPHPDSTRSQAPAWSIQRLFRLGRSGRRAAPTRPSSRPVP